MRMTAADITNVWRVCGSWVDSARHEALGAIISCRGSGRLRLERGLDAVRRRRRRQPIERWRGDGRVEGRRAAERQRQRRHDARLRHVPDGLHLRQREQPPRVSLEQNADPALHERVRHPDGEHDARDARDRREQQQGAQLEGVAGPVRDRERLSRRRAPELAELHRAHVGRHARHRLRLRREAQSGHVLPGARRASRARATKR